MGAPQLNFQGLDLSLLLGEFALEALLLLLEVIMVLPCKIFPMLLHLLVGVILEAFLGVC